MSYIDDVLPHPGEAFYTIDEGGHEKWASMNKGITPVFFMEPIENPTKSAKEGRPIFDELECVRIFIAGDPHNQHCAPVDDHYRERFADAYQKWKVNRNNPQEISGTPLRQWPLLTPLRVKEFEALGIFNVEGLAAIGESNLQRAYGLREWKDKATAWLAHAKNSAFAVEMADENKRLKEDLARLQETVASLAERVESEDKGGPGRPKKAA